MPVLQQAERPVYFRGFTPWSVEPPPREVCTGVPQNQLFYGDNLDVLRRYVKDESVDLVYLDPPFKSDANYNVLFDAKDGTAAAAQIQAFEDTWHWDQASAAQFDETVRAGGDVANALLAFQKLIGSNDMLAYLAMMAPRLKELHRVLKPTGSLYLHCDPTASHYLKLILDAVFGIDCFRSEIAWKRTSAHSSAHRYGPVHDTILYYGRSTKCTWNGGAHSYSADYVTSRFTHNDGRPFKDADLTGAGTRNGETGLPWRGFDPTAKGRHWGYPPAVLDEMDAAGKIYWPKKAGGWPRLKQYLEDSEGIPLQDVWTDVYALNSQASERLGYPTQKPVALLKRILAASSNPGDTILDPFCGCGTTVHAAEELGRTWIGIDVTVHAISLVEKRLRDAFPSVQFVTRGLPTTIDEAAALAERDKFQFQWWVTYALGARGEEKKGADKGIDGRLFFRLSDKDEFQTAIISVKGGKLKATDVRDLRGVLDRESAAIAVLVSLDEPTRPMRAEAASAGQFDGGPWGMFPRLQLLTVKEMLEGKRIAMPQTAGVNVTLKAAKRSSKAAQQSLLDLG